MFRLVARETAYAPTILQGGPTWSREPNMGDMSVEPSCKTAASSRKIEEIQPWKSWSKNHASGVVRMKQPTKRILGLTVTD